MKYFLLLALLMASCAPDLYAPPASSSHPGSRETGVYTACYEINDAYELMWDRCNLAESSLDCGAYTGYGYTVTKDEIDDCKHDLLTVSCAYLEDHEDYWPNSCLF